MPALVCAVTGLTNGTGYWFEVSAVNKLGASAWSARVSATPRTTVPEPPRTVTASGLDERVQVAWMAPSSTGGAAVSGYTATAWSQSVDGSALGTCTTPPVTGTAALALTCTITGLSNGVPVFVDVLARNAVGSSQPSGVLSGSRVQVQPAAPPDAPAAPTVDPGSRGQLLVSWDEPTEDGGSAVLGYEVLVFSAATGGTQVKSCATSTVDRQCLLTGLVNQVSVWVGVRARNAKGWSVLSARTEAIPQADLPGAVTGVAVVPGSGQVAVSWKAPLDNGGSPVKGYTATAFSAATGMDDVGSCVTPPVSGSATPVTRCTITGLANGVSVFVSVTARTLAGEGAAPTPRVSTLPRGVPTVPLAVSAEPAQAGSRFVPGALTVTWQVPSSDGGLPLTGYRVAAYTSLTGTTTAGSGCTVSAALRTCTITGLRNDVAYYVAVRAQNSAGLSADSARDEGTPRAVEPGAPRSVQVSVVTAPGVVAPGNGVVQVTWAAPASDGGLAVTGYTATAFDAASGGTTVDSCDLTALPTASLPCRLDALEPGNTVYVEVSARNTVGTGPASARVSAVPVSLPDAPAPPANAAGNGSLLVSWSAPVSTGGRPITGYTATAFTTETGATSAGRACTTSVTAASAGLSCTITGLTNETTYWVQVVARSSIGTSPASVRSPGIPEATTPGVPVSVGVTPSSTGSQLVTVGPGQLRVAWSKPAADGGSAITGYQVVAWTDRFAGEDAGSCTTTAAQLSCTIGKTPETRLTNGTTYYVSVTASNGKGPGDPSTPRVAGIPRTYPDPPRIAVIEAGNASLLVSWEASDNGGAVITGYTATAFRDATGTTATALCSTSASSLAAPATQCRITGLTNDTTYHVAVTARNALGSSTLSSTPPPARTTGTPIPDAPGAPTAPTATPGPASAGLGSLKIGWAAPTSNGGSRITGYTATAWDQGIAGTAISTCTTNSTTTQTPPTGCTITGLTLGTTYYVAITAQNSRGSGPASTRIGGVPATVPAPPQDLTVTARNTALRLTWAAPPDTGGSPIIRYTARATATGTFTTGSPRCTTTASSLAAAARTCIIPGLINGLTYQVDVAAENTRGTGQPATPTTGIPTQVTPDPPTNLTATPANNALTITFTPGDNGGSPITNYEYTLNDATTTWTALDPADATSPITIPGLTNGTPTSITLRATNSIGASEPSEPITATPATTPNPPTNLTTTPADRSAIIEFTPGDNGGSPITNYEYTLNDGTTWTPLTPPDTTTPITIPGLTNGTPTTIRLRATNTQGPSPASQPTTTTPTGPPGTPTNITWSISGEDVVLSFVAPAGSTPTNHEYSFDNGQTWQAIAPADATSPILLRDLALSYRYTLRLRAINSFGVSAPTAPLTILGALTCAQGGTCQIGDTGPGGGKVFYDAGSTLSWGRYLEAAPVGWYGTVPVPPWNANGIQDPMVGPWCSADTQDLPTGTGIGAGKGNTLLMVANCSDSPSGYGYAQGSCWDPGLVCSSPAIIASRYRGGDKSDWYLPSRDELAQMYERRSVIGGASTTVGDTDWIWWSSSQASATTAWYQHFSIGSITHNTKGWSGRVRPIRAFDAQVSSGGSLGPAGVPGAPSGLAVSVGDTSVSMTFPAVPSGGFPITNFEYSIDDGPWTAMNPARTSSPVTITGLDAENAYALRLRAVNRMGSGASSSPVTVVTTTRPPIPRNVQVVREGSDAVVSFTATTAGVPASNYQFSLDGGSRWTALSPADALSPIRIPGLQEGYRYRIMLRGVNGHGAGGASQEVTLTWAPQASYQVGDRGPGGGTVFYDAGSNQSWGRYLEAAPAGWYGVRLTTPWNADDVQDPMVGPWCSNSSESIATGVAIGKGLTNTNLMLANCSDSPSGFGYAQGSCWDPGLVCSSPAIIASRYRGGGLSDWHLPSLGELRLMYQQRATIGAPQTTMGSTDWLWWTSSQSTATAAHYIHFSIGVERAGTKGWSGRVRPIRAFTPGLASVAESGAPSAPTDLVVTPGLTSAVVSFMPGASGGMPILNYEYRLDGGPWLAVSPADNSSPVGITGLTAGTTYDLEIRAVSVLGSGATSAPVQIQTGAPPGAPTSLSVVPLDGGARVEFTNAAANGLPVSNYQYSINDGASWIALNPADSSSPVAITGLSNTVTYQLRLRAINAAGNGSPSGAVWVRPGTPTTPRNVEVTPTSGGAVVSWDRSSSTGTDPITAYTAYASTSTQVPESVPSGSAKHNASCTVVVDSVQDRYSCTIYGLSNGTVYQVLVGANGYSIGQSILSNPLSVRPQASASGAVPQAPRNLQVMGDNVLTLKWDAPVSSGGSAISGYAARVWNAQSGGEVVGACSADASGRSCTVWMLPSGQRYWVDVVAVNGSGGTASQRLAKCPAGGPCQVGDFGPGGGKVFYDAGSNQSWGRYLEAAPVGWYGSAISAPWNADGVQDPMVGPWCNNASRSLRTGTGIGAGKGNTLLMVANCSDSPSGFGYAQGSCWDPGLVCSSPAIIADRYRGGGKSDWHLPSRDELSWMYQRRAVIGGASTTVGDTDWIWWSSSQASATTAWYQHFSIGSITHNTKGWSGRVRPIRAFS
jgi:titin